MSTHSPIHLMRHTKASVLTPPSVACHFAMCGRCSVAGAHHPANIPSVPFQQIPVESVEEKRIVADTGLIELLRGRVSHLAAGKQEIGTGLERVLVAWQELHEVCEIPVEPGACYRIDSNTVFRAAPEPVVPMYRLQKRHDSITFVHGSMREMLYPLCFLGTVRMHMRHVSRPSDNASVTRLHATQPTKEIPAQECAETRAYDSTPTCLCHRWSPQVRTSTQERSETWLGRLSRFRTFTSGLIVGVRTTPHSSTAPRSLKTVAREGKAFSRRRRSRRSCQNALSSCLAPRAPNSSEKQMMQETQPCGPHSRPSRNPWRSSLLPRWWPLPTRPGHCGSMFLGSCSTRAGLELCRSKSRLCRCTSAI